MTTISSLCPDRGWKTRRKLWGSVPRSSSAVKRVLVSGRVEVKGGKRWHSADVRESVCVKRSTLEWLQELLFFWCFSLLSRPRANHRILCVGMSGESSRPKKNASDYKVLCSFVLVKRCCRRCLSYLETKGEN